MTAMDSLLARVLEATEARAQPDGPLEAFLAAGTTAEALIAWLPLEPGDALPDRARIRRRLAHDLVAIDETLTAQVDAILAHPALQALEASWRGLSWLCESIEDPRRVPVRVLNASWRELVKESAIDHDQSTLFRRVHNDEFDMPGGKPFGVLLGDYALRPGVSEDWPTDDIGTLRSLSQVAAAAFAPWVSSIHPSFLGLESFADLERRIDLGQIFAQHEYTRWNAFRAKKEARFVGLLLPRLLLRKPWPDSPEHAYGFRYRDRRGEESRYLFGNAVWAFGVVLARAFAATGWPAAIRGVQPGVEGGGLVVGPTQESFGTDAEGDAEKPITDVIVTDALEKELSDLGFLPLAHCHGTALAAFYGMSSAQKPEARARDEAGVNARLSSLLHYMLCVSRFAHYLKVIGRDKIGSFANSEECERFLNDWLLPYTNPSEDAGSELQAKCPLREGRVVVSELPDRSGAYQCTFYLRPHFQVDQMSSTVELDTRLAAPRRA